MGDVRVRPTEIDGLLIVDLDVHDDERGWFKENWQRASMTALGLPDFTPVQQNLSHNHGAGVTRGFHAEPWDKLVSVATGRVFGAWVDLRDGPGFGRLVTVEIGPGTAVFVPRGVGNAYQAIEPGTTYSYLVNEHWSATSRDRYTFVNVADPTIACPWPIPLAGAILSDADRRHPLLSEVTPVCRSARTLVVGGTGQLGQALRATIPEAEFLTRIDLDITSDESVAAFDFDHVGVIINAAAWTAVDTAETPLGRIGCWQTNVDGTRRLVEVSRACRATLVQVSSDYVFDGTQEVHDEDEPFSPLSVYGASKAAGDALAATWERHYIVRTSWLIGDGPNFVRTMTGLARKGADPLVVNDQFGRLTFADTLAEAIQHLIHVRAEFGTYNVTNTGPPQSWFDIATEVFTTLGAQGTVHPIATATYNRGRMYAPRPKHSTLNLTKLTSTGYSPEDVRRRLYTYVAARRQGTPPAGTLSG